MNALLHGLFHRSLLLPYNLALIFSPIELLLSRCLITYFIFTDYLMKKTVLLFCYKMILNFFFVLSAYIA